MLDLSKERNVRFLREAGKYLQEKILFLERELIQLKKEQAIDEEICIRLSDELLVLRKKFFTKGVERKKGNGPKRRKKNKLVHSRPPVSEAPEDPPVTLEIEEVPHSIEELKCSTCSDENIRIMKGCFEESSEFDVVERRYVIKRHMRQKYTCPTCQNITTAPGGVKLVPGGEYSIQMAVEIANDKYCDHLPLNRQSTIMETSGLNVDTKTLYSLTDHLASLLSPVPAMIRQEILARSVVHIDESPFLMFRPVKKTGYVWSISNNYGVYYQFELTRSKDVAAELLSGYAGVVVCDGYSGYLFLKNRKGIIVAYCWAHVRRKFFEAMENYPEAEKMVDLIGDLYDIEHEADNFEELKKLRAEKSASKIIEIETWVKGMKGKYLESSSLGKAIFYMTERMKGLKEFLTNVFIPLDNNTAERAQRHSVMGRKNFNGFRTINGADLAMLFYTIIKSCKIHNVIPKTYMLEMAIRAARGETLLTPYEYAKTLLSIKSE